MYAVVSSGDGNINHLSLLKDRVRRHRDSMREQRAKCIFEKTLKQFMIQKVTDICCIGMEKCFSS